MPVETGIQRDGGLPPVTRAQISYMSQKIQQLMTGYPDKNLATDN
jgi:hypothetical protein